MINIEQLEVVRFYLFGGVKWLDLLTLLMAIDIITGIARAIKFKNLWSRKGLYGFSRKLVIYLVIITANVIDQMLGMGGVITFAAVGFYVYNEMLSIIENLAQLNVPLPPVILDKLKVVESTFVNPSKLQEELSEELLGTNVDKELKEGVK